MKTWITPDGSYYVGTHVAEGSIEVPERPSDFHRWVSNAWVLDQAAILDDKIKTMDEAIRTRLNAQAMSMEFESIATAILAASLPIGEFRQEDGAKLHLWAARTWQMAKVIRDAFLAGQRPEPTWQEVESELPTYPIE